MSTMRPALRWGVVGTGAISHRLVPDLQMTAGCEVTAVWGRRIESASEFGGTHGIPTALDDFDSLLARDDVDVVYLATPTPTHRELGLRALEAGKHVLLEKPLAESAAQVEELFDAASRAGRFLMEAMWMRFNPLNRHLVDRISSGLIGVPRSVRASSGTPSMAPGGPWKPTQGHSALLDRGIYPITLAQQILGVPVSISANGRLKDGVDVHAVIELEFEGGRFAQLAASTEEFVDPSASISGTDGWVSIDRMFWVTTSASLYKGMASLLEPPERIEHTREGRGFVPMLRAVTEAIGRGQLEHPDHGRESTLAVARTMDAILALLHRTEGRPVY